MSFLPGIFGKKPDAPTGAGPAIKQPAPANPGADPANMISGTNSQQPAPNGGAGDKPTLDTFSDLFKPKQIDPNAPKRATLSDPLLTPLDPAVFQQHVQNANFTANISPDTVQKALGGDPQAFMEAINTAAREAFSASAQLSQGVSEHAAREAATRLDGTLDSRIRGHAIRTHTSDNPALSHPAAAPMVNAIKAQIAAQNPQLTAADVQKRSEDYFITFADLISAPQREAQKAAEAATKKSNDFSWMLEP